REARERVGGTLTLAALDLLVERLGARLEPGELPASLRGDGSRRHGPDGDRGQRRREPRARGHSEARANPEAPASLASPSTRTTSPSTTWRSPARITTLSSLFAS